MVNVWKNFKIVILYIDKFLFGMKELNFLCCSHGTAKMARFVMQFEAPNKFAQLQVTLKQCCGSGIRCLFDPLIRDPE